MQHEQTRARRTAAARRLVGAGGARVSAEAVTNAAALPARAIRQTYGDFDELLYELLDQLYGGACDRALRLAASMPAGRSRLKLAADGYLQTRFERQGLQALALRLSLHPRARAGCQAHRHDLARMPKIEFKELGWPLPAAAQLCAAAVGRIVVAEAEAGRPLPERRDSLYSHFDTTP